MLIEMHCHTSEYSDCSHVCAVDLVRKACDKGVQGIVLTDHHHLWSVEAIRELHREAAVPGHFRIFPGQEVRTKELGDVLVYGADRCFEKGTSLQEIRRAAPEAALVWAHPYRRGKIPDEEKLHHPGIDAVEIFNANHLPRENSRGLSDWHRHRFTALAGSDAHDRNVVGIFPTLFDHPVETVEELAREIRAGRCHPFMKEIPRAGSRSRVTEVTFGIKGPDEKRERIIIRTHADSRHWKRAERASHILDALGQCGLADGRYRVPEVLDRDEATLTLIESGIRGKTLHERLLQGGGDERRYSLELAARWLARLHNCALQVTDPGEFLESEPKRLARYVKRFTDIGHRHSDRAEDIASQVRAREEDWYGSRPESLVQGHGDFHPKNILIGSDHSDDRSTLFCAAVDFESSLCLPSAFDLGYFLAQYRNQLSEYPDIHEDAPEALFLKSYLDERKETAEGLSEQIDLFVARSNLGIAAFLIKVGLGESEALWRLLVESSAALARCGAQGR